MRILAIAALIYSLGTAAFLLAYLIYDWIKGGDTMNDFSFQLLKMVISVCAALITMFLIPYIKTLRSDKRYAQMLDMVAIAVRAAEQTITSSGAGVAKKERVMDFVQDWMNKQGIDITYEQLSELVEAAVYNMKEVQK